MRRLRACFLRVSALFVRRRHEQEMADEFECHLQMHIEDNLRAGMTEEEARRQALIKLGGLDQVKENYRDRRRLPMLETLLQDIRYGTRMLRKNPGFTAVAILTLALGIGANTAIFSLIDTVMLRMLPVAKPEELMQVEISDPSDGKPYPEFTNPLWEQVRDQQDVFSGAFAWGEDRFDTSQGGAVKMVNGLWVSGGFFQSLGLQPVAGRLMSLSDDQRGCGGVAVLSYGFWQERFAGKPSAVGSVITLNNHPVQIIGVASRGFTGLNVGRDFDVALPICMTAIYDGQHSRLDARSTWWLQIIGRVKPGLSMEKAQARLKVLSPTVMAAALPHDWKPEDQKDFLKQKLVPVSAATGISDLRNRFKDPLKILMAVVGLVLLIACANIASLMIARAASRHKEIAVRQALGASRLRLIRQLLTECVLLSLAGAAVGIVFARWGCTLLVHLMSTTRTPLALQFPLDGRVLAFTAVVAVLTGIIFGVLPAFGSTRVSLTAAMKGSQAAESARHARFRPGILIVGTQVALSLVLLVAAGLFLRSFWKLVTLDIGFDRSNLLLVNANLKIAHVPPEQHLATFEEMESRLRTLPGVVSVGRSNNTPISGSGWNGFFHPDSPNPPTGREALAFRNFISPGYFPTLRTPILAGRNFTSQDTKDSPLVAIVNQTLARKFYPNLNPIGRYFHIEGAPGKPQPTIQIVGVVKDAKYRTVGEVTPPTAFEPIGQIPEQNDNEENFELRTAARPALLASVVQHAVAGVNKEIPLEFRTLENQVDDSLVQQRALATLSGFFGGLALLLAMLGLYGALSYLVTQRQTEFGVRMALGAQPRSILWLVMRQVAAILLVGNVAGVGISLAATRVLQSMLFGLGPRDTVTLMAAVGMLSAVALVAGYLPARRATHVDPMVALRYE
ncbi:MAG TPA: ABC transporter permease [Terriglobia bacterium]|nr:ABC transporter permease [Terriglobia bacterium]